MFWYIEFISFWIAWYLFANKTRWREIFPVCMLASWASLLTEAVINHHFKLWAYAGSTLLSLFANGLGTYMVTTYLFIQWLPEKKTTAGITIYILSWSIFSILLEYLHLSLGYMQHLDWWNLGYSYVSDFFLFLIFFMYYELFHFKRLLSHND